MLNVFDLFNDEQSLYVHDSVPRKVLHVFGDGLSFRVDSVNGNGSFFFSEH